MKKTYKYFIIDFPCQYQKKWSIASEEIRDFWTPASEVGMGSKVREDNKRISDEKIT